MAYLSRHPEIRKKLRADIHMDMVGGDPFKNKSIFHVTATPWSLPSFVTDVGAAFAEVIRSGATNYADTGSAPEAAVVETRAGDQGTRNEFLADVTPYSAGSDHDDYDSSMIAVPSLYLRDWPDIYIHTDHDTLQQIDPTKLRRVALLGAAAGYVYASLDAERSQAVLPFFTAQSEMRLAQLSQQAHQLVTDPKLDPGTAWYEARNLMKQGSSSRDLGSAFTHRIHPGPARQTRRTRKYLQTRQLPSMRGSTARRKRAAPTVRSRQHHGQGRLQRERFRFVSATSGRSPIRTTMSSRLGCLLSGWQKSSCWTAKQLPCSTNRSSPTFTPMRSLILWTVNEMSERFVTQSLPSTGQYQ